MPEFDVKIVVYEDPDLDPDRECDGQRIKSFGLKFDRAYADAL